MKNNLYRHGDVSLHPISEIPEGLTEVKHQGSVVLAEGEFTGHKHLLTAPKLDSMRVLQDKEGRFYIEIGEESQLSHEEHKTLTIAPGLYRTNIEREHDYFAGEKEKERQVMD